MIILKDEASGHDRRADLPDSDTSPNEDHMIEMNAPLGLAKASGSSSVPSDIWDCLLEEFSQEKLVSAGHTPIISLSDHPLLETPGPALNSSDPFAQLACGVDLHQLQQQKTDPLALFKPDAAFRHYEVLADTTPSALLPESSSVTDRKHPALNNERQEELDPLALFKDCSVPISLDAPKSGQ